MTGKQHRRIGLLASPLVIILAFSFVGTVNRAIVICSYFLETYWSHCDRDLAENKNQSFWLFWWAYGKLVSHRHWFSHFPGAGNVGRLVYQLIIIVGTYYVFTRSIPINEILLIAPYFPYWFVGSTVAVALHWACDLTSTETKRTGTRIKKAIGK